MALYATLQSLSTTAGSNAADGAVDAPSTIDQQTNLLASFIAQVRDAQHEYVSAVAGTNTITGTIASSPTSYVVGRTYRFVAAADNTGAVTLNFNSIGAKSLLKVGNAALTGGELKATGVYQVFWDGVNFQLIGMYGFKNSLGSTVASSGYQYFPSGFLVQWGLATAGQAGASAVNSFPTAFSTACFIVMAVHYGGDASVNVVVDQTTPPSTTSFGLRSSFPSSTAAAMYLAIGK